MSMAEVKDEVRKAFAEFGKPIDFDRLPQPEGDKQEAIAGSNKSILIRLLLASGKIKAALADKNKLLRTYKKYKLVDIMGLLRILWRESGSDCPNCGFSLSYGLKRSYCCELLTLQIATVDYTMTVRNDRNEEHCGMGCGEESHNAGQVQLMHTLLVHGLGSMGVPAAPFLKTLFNGSISPELTGFLCNAIAIILKANRLRNIKPAIALHRYASNDIGSVSEGFYDYGLRATDVVEKGTLIKNLKTLGSFTELAVHAAVRRCPPSVPEMYFEYYAGQNRSILCPNPALLKSNADFEGTLMNMVGAMRLARDGHFTFVNTVPKLKGITVGDDGQYNFHAADMDLPLIDLILANQANCVAEAQKVLKAAIESIYHLGYYGWTILDLSVSKIFRKCSGHPKAH